MEETKSNPQANPGHPMLRGGRTSFHKHRFSHAEMETLSAICDTLIPSISPENAEKPIDKAVESFYLLSGTQNGVPRKAAELIDRRIKLAGRILTRCVLLLLATRLGTLILCGSPSLKWGFPFVQSFAEIPRPKREKILVSWSRGSRTALMIFAFKLLKICCLFAFYSWADENAQNPSWKAIGYSPPEPRGDANPDAGRRPLEKSVVGLDLDFEGIRIPSIFEGTGFGAAEQVIDGTGTKAWTVECDAVVVGSGSGGGVAAAVLAKAGYRVIVLEKGKYYAREDFSLLEGPSMDQMYESGGILSTNDGGFMIMAGSTVGGGSAVNWSASIRTPPHVLKEWAKQHDLPMFESREYQNAMNIVCERLGVQDSCREQSFQNAILRNGCAKLGLNVDAVPRNSSPDHFCGSCCFGCRTGDKKGTDETWLVDAARANALILAGCTAERVVLGPNPQTGGTKNRKAVGVVAKIGNAPDRLFIRAKLTVAACGSLRTPPLLLASGLRNPNIGRNLRLHPVKMAWGYFPDSYPGGKSYEGGIITAICKEGMHPDRSGYGTIIQTPSLAPGSFSAMVPWTSGADMKHRMRRYDRTAHLFVLARDTGSGTVLKPNDIRYKLAESDDRKLAEGLSRALRILIAAGAREVGTHRSDGSRLDLNAASGDDIDNFLSTAGNSSRSAWSLMCSAHQMGSCRMGTDEKSSAVDANGETWEVQGLFVCDGSVLPTALGVNPMITIQSTALCISKSMLHFLAKFPAAHPPSSSAMGST